jgi:hypothetical protein
VQPSRGNKAEGEACVERSRDERVPQAVRADPLAGVSDAAPDDGVPDLATVPDP